MRGVSSFRCAAYQCVFHYVVINWCAEEIEAQRSIKQLLPAVLYGVKRRQPLVEPEHGLPGGHADDKRCFLHFDRGFRRGFCQGLSYAQFYLVKADLMPLFTVRSFLLSSEHEADIGFLIGRLGASGTDISAVPIGGSEKFSVPAQVVTPALEISQRQSERRPASANSSVPAENEASGLPSCYADWTVHLLCFQKPCVRRAVGIIQSVHTEVAVVVALAEIAAIAVFYSAVGREPKRERMICPLPDEPAAESLVGIKRAVVILKVAGPLPIAWQYSQRIYGRVSFSSAR